MKTEKKKTMMFLFATAMVVCVAFWTGKEYDVKRSTVASSERLTEVCLHVVLHEWGTVDREKTVKEILHRQPPVGDGSRPVIFKIELYRTDFHYRHEWKCDTVFCDEKGNIVDGYPL